MPEINENKLMGSGEVAKLFGVTGVTAKGWMQSKKFGEPIQVNRRWYVSESEVIAYINRRHGES